MPKMCKRPTVAGCTPSSAIRCSPAAVPGKSLDGTMLLWSKVVLESQVRRTKRGGGRGNFLFSFFHYVARPGATAFARRPAWQSSWGIICAIGRRGNHLTFAPEFQHNRCTIGRNDWQQFVRHAFAARRKTYDNVESGGGGKKLRFCCTTASRMTSAQQSESERKQLSRGVAGPRRFTARY